MVQKERNVCLLTFLQGRQGRSSVAEKTKATHTKYTLVKANIAPVTWLGSKGREVVGIGSIPGPNKRDTHSQFFKNSHALTLPHRAAKAAAPAQPNQLGKHTATNVATRA